MALTLSRVSADLFDVSGTDDSPVLILRVMAHPGAGRTSVVGVHGDALKVRVGAPPVGGRANEALVELVAELFGVKATAVSVSSGQTSRTKRITVTGVNPADGHRLLDEALSRAGSGAARSRRGPAPLQRKV